MTLTILIFRFQIIFKVTQGVLEPNFSQQHIPEEIQTP